MNARDPYLHENLTPDQIALIEEGMRNTVIDGIALNPRDTVSNPEKFNSYPFEMRKRAFEMLPKLVSGRDQYMDMATGRDVGTVRQVGMRGNDPISSMILGSGTQQASPQAAPQAASAAPADPVSSLILGAGTQEAPAAPAAAPAEPKKPRSLSSYVGKPSDIGPAAASLADVTIGGVVPGVVGPITYAGARAFGKSPQEATALQEKVTQPFTDPFGKAFGVTESPAYKGEAGRQLMDFISQNISKGADWIAEKTGLPKSDIENMAGTVGFGAGVKAGQVVGAKTARPYDTGAPAVIEGATPKVEPMIGKPRVSYAELQKQLEEQKTKPRTRMGAQPAGASAVDLETQRIQKAQELPIPITLEKSQATRDPADVRFARETAKNPTFGGPFQEKYAEQNRLLQQNLDYFIEQTGSERVGVPPTEFAKTLDDLVNRTKKERKNEIDRAYTEARNAGETAEVINVQNLSNWVKENASASENAPVIKTVEKEIKRLSKNNEISLNDIEEIRKTINNVRDVSPTNARYGGKAIKVIDEMTADKGGELYKKARGLNTAFATEFQDTPVVAKITGMKRGTTQRQVALENLAESTMMKGTGEDVRQLFKSLERMGPEGQAMINDLRGYVAQYIKDQATKGTQLDIYGKRYISTPELDKVITNLDKSGKLEFLFGKKGAEQYRTINDVVKDIQTVPKETTNPSGTAAQLGQLVAEMGTQYALTGVPVPLIMVGKELAKKRKEKKEMKKIRDFIEYGNKKD